MSKFASLAKNLNIPRNVYFSDDIEGVSEHVERIENYIDVKTENLDEEDEEVIQEVVDEVMDEENSDNICADSAGEFCRLGRYSASIINNTFGILKYRVRKDVEELMSKINAKSSHILAANNLLPQLIDKPVKHHQYYLKWDNYIKPFGGEANIRLAVSELSRHTAFDGDAVADAIENVVHDIDYLPIDDETKADIIDRVKESVDENHPTHADTDTVSEVVDMLFDPIQLNAMLDKVCIHRNNVPNLSTIETAKALDKYYRIMRRFKATPLNVSAELLDQWADRVDKFKSLLVLLAGQMLDARHTYFEDSVALTPEVYNDDFRDAVVGEDLEEAIDTAVTTELPETKSITGISLSMIRQNKQAILDTFNSNKEALINRRNAVLISVMDESIKETLTEYVESTPEDLIPEDTLKESYVEEAANEINATTQQLSEDPDGNVEALLYDFVINTRYNLPQVKEAHKMLNERVLAIMQAKSMEDPKGDELNDDEIDQAENDVKSMLLAKSFVKLLKRKAMF